MRLEPSFYLEADVFEPLLINIAGRFERYSDFGSTINGKSAFCFEPVEELAFRGTAQTGFRAPNQAQKLSPRPLLTISPSRRAFSP